MRRIALLVALAALVGLIGLTAAPAGAEPATTTTTSAEPTTTSTPSTTTTTTPTTTTTTPSTSTPSTTATTPATTTTPAPESADPAPAATPSIVVTPSTALGYLQDVAISGTGFAANAQVGFAECETGLPGATGCDFTTARLTTTDANGAFSGTITVRRFVHNEISGTVDCADAPGTCSVGAGSLDGTQGTDTPLTFDPNAPIPPPPTIAADPDTDLGLVTSVHVTGSGFQPGGPTILTTCTRGSTDPSDCSTGFSAFAFADADGNLDTTVEVRRGIRTENQLLVDCLDFPECDLIAYNANDPDRRGIAPLAFDPSVAVPPPLGVTVTPGTDLADNTIATVTVTGLEPFEGAALAQCPAGAPLSDGCAPLQFADGDDSGTAQLVLRLHRSIGPEGSPLDCAGGSGVCELSVIGFNDAFHHGAAPLDFDPSAPPLPGPTITVVPDADLVHKQVVTVTGTGFLPNSSVNVFECTHDHSCGFGQPSTFTSTDGDGNFETQLAVHRGLRISDGSVFDCTDPTGCDVIAAELDHSGTGVGALAATPIGFDASVPPPAPRSVSVDPPGPYADRQIVRVSSAGFEPGEQVFLLQCAGSGAAVSQCRSLGFASVGADGTVHGGVRVHRSLETFDSLEAAVATTGDGETGDVGAAATFDCAVDECSIVVFSFSDAYATGATPLVIDPSLPSAPPPTLVATPTFELLDGQVLAVHGSGFTPNHSVVMVECRAASSDQTGGACDLSKTLQSVNANDDGSFDATFTARRSLATSVYGVVDCAKVPEGCILGWGGTGDLEVEQGNVPLNFLGDVFVEGIVETAPGGLPRTGSNSAQLAVWGALAVIAGLGLRVVSRRRRRGGDAAVPDDVELS